MRNENAPGRRAEGVVCLLAGDTDASTTTPLRHQLLSRLGVPFSRRDLIAGLAWEASR